LGTLHFVSESYWNINISSPVIFSKRLHLYNNWSQQIYLFSLTNKILCQ
jgi:hypothetical protein